MMCLVWDTSRFKSQASSQKLVHFSLLLAEVVLGNSLVLAISILPGPSLHPPWSQLIDQGKGSDPWIFACWLVSRTWDDQACKIWMEQFFFRHLNLRCKRDSWCRDRRKKHGEKWQGKGKSKSMGVVESWVGPVNSWPLDYVGSSTDLQQPMLVFPFWPGRVTFHGSGELWPQGHDSFSPCFLLLPNSKAPWLTKKGD